MAGTNLYATKAKRRHIPETGEQPNMTFHPKTWEVVRCNPGDANLVAIHIFLDYESLGESDISCGSFSPEKYPWIQLC